MDKVKLGMIGCGGIAFGKHLPSVKSVGLADLAAVCDLVEERALKAKKEYGTEDTKVFTDYRQLLEEKLDAVLVCTPNRSHSVISVDALNAGMHVLCEKPMAINTAEALKMLDAAKRNGKLLTIGYQSRQKPESRYLKEMCDAGELGEIYFARANAVRRRGVPTWGVFLNEYEQGGGALIDIGTHALDLTLWLMNNYQPKYVSGTVYHKLNGDTDQGNPWGKWDPAKFSVEDAAFGFIVMENGATVQLNASWALNTLDVKDGQTMLCGTKAGADMMDGLRINGVKRDRQYVFRPDMTAGGAAFYEGNANEEPSAAEHRVFMNAVLGKGSLCVLPEQALTVTKILEGIYLSAASGKPYFFA